MFFAVVCINLLQNEPIFVPGLQRETKNQQVIIDDLGTDHIFWIPLQLQMVTLNIKEWFSPSAFFL